MSRNRAFDEGVGKSRERNVVKPRSLADRHPMLFDPQYDAPEGHGPVGKEEEVTSQTFWPNGRCEGCGNGLNDHGQCQSEDCSENPHFEDSGSNES